MIPDAIDTDYAPVAFFDLTSGLDLAQGPSDRKTGPEGLIQQRRPGCGGIGRPTKNLRGVWETGDTHAIA